MKKKTIMLIIIPLLMISIIGFWGFYSYSKASDILFDHKVNSQSENVQRSYKGYEGVQCGFSLLDPEYAAVSHLHYIYPEDDVDMKSWTIGFYSFSRPHILSSNWKMERIGGTDVTNTTFPELVEMAKEDCEQFKQGYTDYTGYENLSEEEKDNKYWEIHEKNLSWTYTPYTPEPFKEPEDELTEEQKERMRQKTLENRANAKPIEDYYSDN